MSDTPTTPAGHPVPAPPPPAPPAQPTKRSWSGFIRDSRDWLYRSPVLRTAVGLTGAIIVGVFTNTIVTEMTDANGGIVWGAFYRTYSFYVLLVAIGLNYLFHRHLYLHERRVDAFKDDEFCVAYARSQLLPEQVEVYRQRIRQGNTQDFTAAMASIKKVLKLK